MAVITEYFNCGRNPWIGIVIGILLLIYIADITEFFNHATAIVVQSNTAAAHTNNNTHFPTTPRSISIPPRSATYHTQIPSVSIERQKQIEELIERVTVLEQQHRNLTESLRDINSAQNQIDSETKTVAEVDGVYNNSLKIGVPALMISGPPKTGTRSLIDSLDKYDDVWSYPTEHFWWGPPKHGVDWCAPDWNSKEWNQWIEAYSNNTTTLSALVDEVGHSYIPKGSHDKTCDVVDFQKTYKSALSRKPKQCVNPLKEGVSLLMSSEYVTYCWFVEKAPVYARRPIVPIMISNLLPTTRYLTILRNPVTHVWSNYFHFGSGKSIHDPTKREKNVIRQFEAIASIPEINKLCTKISGIWKGNKGSDAVAMNQRERYLAMREHLKEIVAEYFKRRFISPKDIMAPYDEQEGSKIIWATYHVPVLVIGMMVNDEVFIERGMTWNRWDPLSNEMVNYKWIQFEWLWGDTLDSMRLIRCWMSQGLRIDNEHCEFQRDDPLNIEMFPVINKTNSRAGSTFSKWYSDHIKEMFNPCFDLVVNCILEDRPNLLLGEWRRWKYFEY